MSIRLEIKTIVNSFTYGPIYNAYRLDELLGKSDIYFENNRDGHIFIPNLKLIKENFDEFSYIISKGKFLIVDTLYYKVLEFL